MTTPTQVQIEAVEIIQQLLRFADGHDLQEPAITELRKLKQRAYALTAAAQVGEPDHAAEASAYLRDKAHKHEIAATIERCAQWLKSEALALRSQASGGDGSEPQWIEAKALDRAAAAIRKLKDGP